MTQSFWLDADRGGLPYLVIDNQGALVKCDECPCTPPPWCPVCQDFKSRPYYFQTNYLKIMGVACNEDCDTTIPHVIGTYDTRYGLDDNPDWLGCVWAEWVTPGGDCLNWYGVTPDCTITYIGQSKSCSDPPDPPPPLFVPGRYRLKFDFKVYTTHKEYIGSFPYTAVCVIDKGDGWIDPLYCFNSFEEFQDYVAYIEATTSSASHSITAEENKDGDCVLIVDGEERFEERLDWVLDYYEYLGDCVGNETTL